MFVLSNEMMAAPTMGTQWSTRASAQIYGHCIAHNLCSVELGLPRHGLSYVCDVWHPIYARKFRSVETLTQREHRRPEWL